VEVEKYEPRCVVVDGKPLPDVRILLIKEEFVKVIVAVGCREFYGFLFKSDAEEFIKRRFGLERFVVERC
jgi:hypothetical protein